MPRINTNITSMTSATALRRTDRHLNLSMERLSTGNSINRSSDNAAGLSISEKLRAQANGLAAGNRNIQDGMSMLNIADGVLVEVQNMTQRIRELAVQASTGTVNDDQRLYIQEEVEQLIDEVDRIIASTRFNGRTMLNGNPGVEGTHNFNPWESPEGGFIHIGAHYATLTDRSDILNIRFSAANAQALGLRDLFHNNGPAGVTGMNTPSFVNPNYDPADPDSGPQFWDTISLRTPDEALGAIAFLDAALDNLNTSRSNIGAYTNRLTHAFDAQMNAQRNVESAESQIRHVDISRETINFTRLQVMQQTSLAMLAQANQMPNNILTLLS